MRRKIMPFFKGEEELLAGLNVEEIIFPDTVREIGNYIFYGCKKLRKAGILRCAGTDRRRCFYRLRGTGLLKGAYEVRQAVLREGNLRGTVAAD